MRSEWYPYLGMLLLGLTLPGSARSDETTALKRDVEVLRRQLQETDTAYKALKAELDEARAAIVQARLQADAFEHRCKKLQDDLALIRSGKFSEVQRATGGLKTEVAVRKKPANEPMQGKIVAIGKDGRLLQVSIGFEHGVKNGQTLEVFRLSQQRPVYLGTMTIHRVDPQSSLGEFSGVQGVNYRPAIGDEVASELFVR